MRTTGTKTTGINLISVVKRNEKRLSNTAKLHKLESLTDIYGYNLSNVNRLLNCLRKLDLPIKDKKVLLNGLKELQKNFLKLESSINLTNYKKDKNNIERIEINLTLDNKNSQKTGLKYLVKEINYSFGKVVNILIQGLNEIKNESNKVKIINIPYERFNRKTNKIEHGIKTIELKFDVIKYDILQFAKRDTKFYAIFSQITGIEKNKFTESKIIDFLDKSENVQKLQNIKSELIQASKLAKCEA